MATRIRKRESDISLSSAIALLLQNQARFVAHADEDRRRFARIERELEEIKAILWRHDEILRNLPEAIRQKVGFKQ
jgi:hypothetical protein